MFMFNGQHQYSAQEMWIDPKADSVSVLHLGPQTE
jgi:hypothetical protein